MNCTATISTKLHEVDCAIEFVEPLEVSLDCYLCQRRRRTIVFKDVTNAYCTPTKHRFDGRLISKQCGADSAVYIIEYNYISFTDKKYPDEERYAAFEKGSPVWARINFIAKCPRCGKQTQLSTQSNLVRPSSRSCRCGHKLFIDNAPPQIIWQIV